MPAPQLIAIDGPSASGKTTVGQLLARRLGYSFLDTGIMYRALTWLALKHGIDPEDEAGLAQLAQEVTLSVISTPDGGFACWAEGEDLTDKLRRPEVDAAVSLVSRVAEVRHALVAQQRELAQGGRMVMVGRDIGTAVLPQARLKVFLEASPQVRAERRHRDQREKGEPSDLAAILADQERRDGLDRGREISPLRPAPDAVIIATDALSPDEVMAAILALIPDP